MRSKLSRVLIISDDVVSSKMAGIAIRYWEFARALSHDHEVTLAIPSESDLQPQGFTMSPYDVATLRRRAMESEVIILSGLTLVQYPFLWTCDVPLVVGLYHSFVLENLQLFSHRDMRFRLKDHNALTAALNDQLAVGDFFICNSERQRDYWLGMLSALNRINPLTYDEDPTLRSLIDVVPFGLPDDPPVHRKPVLKGVYPGIGLNDWVAYWGGGIYNWLDPLTLIRATAQVVPAHPELKVFFAATRHPNPRVHVMKMCDDAIRLSKELGLYNRHVFFNEWIPYEERENYLLEADVGISLHLEHLETHFAFRNRMLDYIWAGLPVIVTEGDTASDLVREHNLGWVVGYQDVEGVALALRKALETPSLRERCAPCFTILAERYRWNRVIEPLARFCAAPRIAPDKQRSDLWHQVSSRPLMVSTWPERLRKGWRLWQEQGFHALWREVHNFLDWYRQVKRRNR